MCPAGLRRPPGRLGVPAPRGSARRWSGTGRLPLTCDDSKKGARDRLAGTLPASAVGVRLYSALGDWSLHVVVFEILEPKIWACRWEVAEVRSSCGSLAGPGGRVERRVERCVGCRIGCCVRRRGGWRVGGGARCGMDPDDVESGGIQSAGAPAILRCPARPGGHHAPLGMAVPTAAAGPHRAGESALDLVVPSLFGLGPYVEVMVGAGEEELNGATDVAGLAFQHVDDRSAAEIGVGAVHQEQIREAGHGDPEMGPRAFLPG